MTQDANIYTKWTTVSSWRYVLTVQWINYCGNGCYAAYVSIPQGTYLDLTTLRYIVNNPDETLFNSGEHVHWPLNSDYFNVVYTNRSTGINYDTTVLIDYNKTPQIQGYQVYHFNTNTMNYYNPWGLAVFLETQNITIDVDEYTTPTITWN